MCDSMLNYENVIETDSGQPQRGKSGILGILKSQWAWVFFNFDDVTQYWMSNIGLSEDPRSMTKLRQRD